MNDGGPAFPHGPLGDTMHGEDGRESHQFQAYSGMSLRQWYAGMATEWDIQYWLTDKRTGAREAARFKYADAMLAERDKRTEPDKDAAEAHAATMDYVLDGTQCSHSTLLDAAKAAGYGGAGGIFTTHGAVAALRSKGRTVEHNRLNEGG